MKFFRWQRGSFVDSFKTVQPCTGRAELISLLRFDLARFDYKFEDDAVHVMSYGDGIDERCGWDTHIVTIDGYGVAGFTDGLP